MWITPVVKKRTKLGNNVFCPSNLGESLSKDIWVNSTFHNPSQILNLTEKNDLRTQHHYRTTEDTLVFPCGSQIIQMIEKIVTGIKWVPGFRKAELIFLSFGFHTSNYVHQLILFEFKLCFWPENRSSYTKNNWAKCYVLRLCTTIRSGNHHS